MPSTRAASSVLGTIALAVATTGIVGASLATAAPVAATSARAARLPTAQAPAAPKPLTPATGFGGSIVVDWNRQLLQIVQTPSAKPATIHPTRSFAILHAAMYDAVVSIERNASPYLFSVPVKPGSNEWAAAAEAGHAVLTALYPSWKSSLDDLLAAELKSIPAGWRRDRGTDVGDRVASILLAVRAGDGSAKAAVPFTDGTQPGQYRHTPPNNPAPVFEGWGTVQPFVLDSGSQFRTAPPPALGSAAYAGALNEVKSLGQNTSTTRTAEQTAIAKFWAPPIWNTWNAIADTQATAHRTNLERTAALFATLNLSFADATIAFYDSKYHYSVWRPVTAVRLADTDGNPATAGDPTWLPLANTAPDPSYPGAHSTISFAASTVLAAFFGDHDSITATSPGLPGVVETYNSYLAVATEAGLSRIYAGQHFRFDHVAGLELGRSVARFVLGQTGIAKADGHDGDGDSD